MKNKVGDRFFGDLYEISFCGFWVGYWDFLRITGNLNYRGVNMKSLIL